MVTISLGSVLFNGGDPTALTYSYSVTLSQPLLHVDGSPVENNLVLQNVTFHVTDSDGDTSTGAFDVTIVDDAPQANADADTAPNDGTDATGNVITGVGTDSGASGGRSSAGS